MKTANLLQKDILLFFLIFLSLFSTAKSQYDILLLKNQHDKSIECLLKELKDLRAENMKLLDQLTTNKTNVVDWSPIFNLIEHNLTGILAIALLSSGSYLVYSKLTKFSLFSILPKLDFLSANNLFKIISSLIYTTGKSGDIGIPDTPFTIRYAVLNNKLEKLLIKNKDLGTEFIELTDYLIQINDIISSTSSDPKTAVLSGLVTTTANLLVEKSEDLSSVTSSPELEFDLFGGLTEKKEKK